MDKNHKIQCKICASHDTEELQTLINGYIITQDCELIDIKFSVSSSEGVDRIYALILYK